MRAPITATAALIATLAVASHGAASNDDSTFPIQLGRTFQVGQKLHVRCDGLQDRVATTLKDGAPAQMDDHTVSVVFDAVCEVRRIDQNGQPDLVSFTVTRCVMDRGSALETIAPGGATLVVTTSGDGKAEFTIDGNPVTDPDQVTALQMVAVLPVATGDDAIFGSTTERRVGDGWSINVDAALNNLAAQGNPNVTRGDISGTSTLVGVTNERGQKCLIIQHDIRTENLMPADLPADCIVKATTMTTSVEGIYPIDPTQPPARQSVDMTFNATMTGPAGPGGVTREIRLVATRTVQREITPLSGNGAVASGTQPSGTPE
jgi:hypothetical protein